MQVWLEAELAPELGVFDVVGGADVVVVAGETSAGGDAQTFRELAARPSAMSATTDDAGRVELDVPDGEVTLALRVSRVAAPAHPGGAIAVRPQYLVVDAGLLAKSDGRIVLPHSAWRTLKRAADVWTVVGRVRARGDRPAPELVVDVFDADIVQHDTLGRAVTDAEGRFRVDFRARDFHDAPVGPGELFEGPDLFFHVTTPGGEVLLREKAVRGHVPDRANRGAVSVVELSVDIAVPDRSQISRGGPKGIQRRHALFTSLWATKEDTATWTARGYAHRAAMRAPLPEDDDPGPNHLGLHAQGARIELRDAPTKILGHGQARTFVEVETKSPVTIQIPIAPAHVEHLDPASLRLFQWHAATSSWTLIERSGLGGDGTYVFGRVMRSGTYGVFGLPRDQARLVLLRILWEATALFPLYDAAKVDRTDIPRALARALLDERVVASKLLSDPQRLARIGLPDLVGDLALLVGHPLGDLPRDAKGKPIGEPEGYPTPLFLLGHPSPGFRVGGFDGGGFDGGGFGGLGGLPGHRTGNPAGWEPGDELCPPLWWQIPELQLIPIFGRGRWGIVPRIPRLWFVWESVGPANVPGRMKSIAWHPTDPSIVYCGATGGGVWRSTNAGVDWTPLWVVEQSLAVGAVAVAPSAPDTIYAGTGEYHSWGSWNGSSLSGVGVYRSPDGGTHWDLLPAGASTRISAIVVDPTNADRIYVAGNSGVHRFDPVARTWTQILASECSSLVVDPAASGRLYAAIEGTDGVVRTNDARASTVTWTPFNTGIAFPATVPKFGKLAISPANSGVLYLSVNNEPPAGSANPWWSTTSHVYRWNGTTWVDRGSHGGTTYGGWCNAIAVDPSNVDHVLVGGTGLEESTDGGQTWTGRSAGHSDQHALAFSPTNSRLSLLANDGGIWRRDTTPSNHSNDYAISSRGLATTELYDVSVSRTGAFRIGGATQDNGVIKSDGSSTFVGMGGNEGGLFEVDPNDSRIIYWDPWDGNLRRTTTGQGSGGTAATTGIAANADGSMPSVQALAVKRGDSQIVVCATDSGVVYRSTNGATSWSQVVASAGGVNRFAWAPSQPARCYFVTSSGQVWRSDNDGASFASVAGATLPPGNLCGLAVDWTDAATVYVTYAGIGIGQGHIYRSIDAGVTWTDISGSAANRRVSDLGFYAIAVRKSSPDTLYAACDLGVFVTRDGGDWWHPFDEGLPNALVTDMDYDDTTDTLYLSTSSRGFWRRQLL